jgi:hypothetical protein
MKKYFALAFALVILFSLISCAQPVKRSSAFMPEGGRIESVEIVLEGLKFGLTFGALEALNSEGWSNGTLERKFCDDLFTRLGAAKVRARCERSVWGVRVPFEKDSRTMTHVLSIRPINVSYLAQTRYGVVVGSGGGPSFETLTRITNKATGVLAWEGDVVLGFAPVDKNGARRYSESLIEALQKAQALSNN